MPLQSDSIPFAEADEDFHTVIVADHGIDPRPIPRNARNTPAKHKATNRTRKRGPAHRRVPGPEHFGLKELMMWCVFPIILILCLRFFLFGLYSIPSGSMMDTIQIGDHVVTSKLSPSPVQLQRGDVIVFKDPAHWLQSESATYGSDYLIKRLIGLPGDVIACQGAGKPVTINGIAINETSYIRPGVDPSSFAFQVKVTAGHVFVMGDNRSNSADSRYHQDDGADGLVPINDVVGVGLAVYWPMNRIHSLSPHHEVFAEVPTDSSGE